MAMWQPTSRAGLPHIIDGMSAQLHRMYHLVTVRLSHPNLSLIENDKRCTLHEALLEKLQQRCQANAPSHNFRFKSVLYSLDATTIDLCLSVFPLADFRTTNGVIKLHVGLSHNGYLPEYVTQHILGLLQLNLFEKRDLMVLLRGDPPNDKQPDIHQMALL